MQNVKPAAQGFGDRLIHCEEDGMDLRKHTDERVLNYQFDKEGLFKAEVYAGVKQTAKTTK